MRRRGWPWRSRRKSNPRPENRTCRSSPPCWLVGGGPFQFVSAHPQGDLFNWNCALGATEHVRVQLTETSVALHHIAPVISAVEAFVPPTPTQTISTFALFTRPPPVDLVLA